MAKAKIAEFLGYTIGLRAISERLSRPVQSKVEFNRMTDGTVRLSAVSGNTGGDIRSITPVFITAAQWEDRPYDPYDRAGLAIWAMDLLGLQVAGALVRPGAAA